MAATHVKSFISGMLLVPLAWIGIVLFLRLRDTKWFLPFLVIWVVLFLADLAWTVWLTTRSRGERVNAPAGPRSGH